MVGPVSMMKQGLLGPHGRAAAVSRGLDNPVSSAGWLLLALRSTPDQDPSVSFSEWQSWLA